MFKHILVPIDGSPVSMRAVDKAIGLAQSFGSRLTTIFVLDPYPYAGIGAEYAYGQNQYLMAANAQANSSLAEAKSVVEKAGLSAGTSVVEAHTIWRGVVETAESSGADLIVMGSHGRSGLGKLVLGSVTQAVLSHTKLPVLVVRG